MAPKQSPDDQPQVPALTVDAVRLLDAEPDFASALPPDEVGQALADAVFVTVSLPPGGWRLDDLNSVSGVQGHVYGFLVMSGVLTLDVRVAGRECARLVTPSDVVLLDGVEADSIPSQWGWTVLHATRLAILDQRLLLVARRWPLLLGAIVNRAAQQTRRAHMQQAISQLPRVEDRLLALFWSLADQLGTARPDGVWIPLVLTHDAIARMIGARRPTVTLGLNALAEESLLTRHSGGWLVDRGSLRLFTQS